MLKLKDSIPAEEMSKVTDSIDESRISATRVTFLSTRIINFFIYQKLGHQIVFAQITLSSCALTALNERNFHCIKSLMFNKWI